MAEHLTIAQGGKADRYAALLPQIEALVAAEPDVVADLANVAAAIYETFGHLWVGFYLVRAGQRGQAEQLVLGPFQGPLACTRINRGRGVCGTAWERGTTVVVPDVEAFPGHIACSSRSRSEIVVPLKRADGSVWGVLDIDSEATGTFDAVDAHHLEQLCHIVDAHCAPTD